MVCITHGVYSVYGLYVVYSVYSVYSVYGVYVVYSVYSVYGVYVVYSVYSVYGVYGVCRGVHIEFVWGGVNHDWDRLFERRRRETLRGVRGYAPPGKF